MIYPNITLNVGPGHLSFSCFDSVKETASCNYFAKKKQASHQNADLIPLANLFNLEREMSSMRCIYHVMLKILIQWEQFIFLHCDILKKIYEKSSIEIKYMKIEKHHENLIKYNFTK